MEWALKIRVVWVKEWRKKHYWALLPFSPLTLSKLYTLQMTEYNYFVFICCFDMSAHKNFCCETLCKNVSRSICPCFAALNIFSYCVSYSRMGNHLQIILGMEHKPASLLPINGCFVFLVLLLRLFLMIILSVIFVNLAWQKRLNLNTFIWLEAFTVSILRIDDILMKSKCSLKKYKS